MAGLTPQGFEPKLLEDILQDIKDRILSDVSPQFNLASGSPWGKFIGIYGSKLRELWEVAEAVHASLDPNSSVGLSLSNIGEITQVLRLPGQKTLVTMDLTVNAGFPGAAAGTLFVARATDTTVTYVNQSAIAASPGGGVLSEVFESPENGSFSAPANDITVIQTPLPFLVSVTNPSSAAEGFETEEDEDYRIRRAQEVQGAGKATLPALTSATAVSNVAGIKQNQIIKNDSDVNLPSGQTPHSIRPIFTEVTGGAVDQQEYAQAVFDTVGSGIETYGAITEQVTYLGKTYDINFDLAAEIPIYLRYEITVDTNQFNIGTSEAVLRQKVVDEAEARFGIGDDVISVFMRCIAIDFPGVIDISIFRIDIVSPPIQSINIPIEDDEVASFQVADIIVIATAV